jgi:hypothetical protein
VEAKNKTKKHQTCDLQFVKRMGSVEGVARERKNKIK